MPEKSVIRNSKFYYFNRLTHTSGVVLSGKQYNAPSFIGVYFRGKRTTDSFCIREMFYIIQT